mgnify:CR=1 FL=1
MKVVNSNLKTWIAINFRATVFFLALNTILGVLTYIIAYAFYRGSDSFALVLLGAQILPGSEAPFASLILDPFRFLTSAFLHGGIVHLLFNMYALYAIGGFVERYYGSKKMFTAYIITAISGSLLSFVMSLLSVWNNSGVASGVAISVGASGAVFGLIGLILGNKFLKKNTYSMDLNIDIGNLIWIVVINIFLGFSLNSLGTGVIINNWAHIGGLAGGLILGSIFDTSETFHASRFKQIFEKSLFILSVLLFVLAWVFNVYSIVTRFIII